VRAKKLIISILVGVILTLLIGLIPNGYTPALDDPCRNLSLQSSATPCDENRAVKQNRLLYGEPTFPKKLAFTIFIIITLGTYSIFTVANQARNKPKKLRG
jgi:Na+/H+-translocating membrane pyrophosphatase